MTVQLVDTETAAAHFGIDSNVIRVWKARRRITPDGLVPGRGRGGMVPLYRLDSLAPLVERYLASQPTRVTRTSDTPSPLTRQQPPSGAT